MFDQQQGLTRKAERIRGDQRAAALQRPVRTLREKCKVDVRHIHLIFNKHEHPEDIEEAVGMPIHVMLNVKVVDGKVVEFTP